MIPTKERKEVAREDKWNVEAMYPSLEDWQKEFESIGNPQKKPHWPEIAKFQNKLGEGALVLKEFFDTSLSIERKLSKLYTYAHMRHDEDLANEDFKKAHTLITALFHDFGMETSFAEPEILSLPDALLQEYLKEDGLKEYRFFLERIVRQKPHTLSAEKEELLAMVGMPLGAASRSFNAFNNADLKFPNVKNSKGKELEMTHATYMLYLREKDRVLRENAFKTMYKSFGDFENTLCELINGQVQKTNFHKKARSYSSCLEAALFSNQIDTKVYTNLIETVRNNLSGLHRYMSVRKKALGVDTLHMYDLHVPIVEDVDFKYDYAKAEEMVIASVAPLGEEYQSILQKGLKEGRWVDRYENKRKRSGAYSSGCYDSMPYILMNFQGAFHDLMTLAHEAGHSMHSYYSHANQPYQYSHYPIFLAEVASTFNEELMFHYLMKQGLQDKEKAFLLNQKIEDIRSTFFRQTMFAEFELFIHKLAEDNIPLTPGQLKEFYYQLNKDYFGSDVEVDPEISIEWARIPHFYSSFYVYQYATGISAAHALYEKVMGGKEEDKAAYLRFLSSGSKNYPLDLLNEAGVTMQQKEPIESVISHFDHLVKELEKYICQ